MGLLSTRLPNLVALLQPESEDGEAILVRQGCAQSLELALLDPSAGQGVSSGVAATAAGAESDAGGQLKLSRVNSGTLFTP